MNKKEFEAWGGRGDQVRRREREGRLLEAGGGLEALRGRSCQPAAGRAAHEGHHFYKAVDAETEGASGTSG
jgi:hypothetical protein